MEPSDDAALRDRARSFLPLTALDFHLLMVLAEGALYGYAILKAMAAESEGTVAPEIGSLYRAIGRLTSQRLVVETDVEARAAAPSRGLPRRYYRLTDLGRAVLGLEAGRLRALLTLAEARNVLPAAAGG